MLKKWLSPEVASSESLLKPSQKMSGLLIDAIELVSLL